MCHRLHWSSLHSCPLSPALLLSRALYQWCDAAIYSFPVFQTRPPQRPSSPPPSWLPCVRAAAPASAFSALTTLNRFFPTMKPSYCRFLRVCSQSIWLFSLGTLELSSLGCQSGRAVSGSSSFAKGDRCAPQSLKSYSFSKLELQDALNSKGASVPLLWNQKGLSISKNLR